MENHKSSVGAVKVRNQMIRPGRLGTLTTKKDPSRLDEGWVQGEKADDLEKNVCWSRHVAETFRQEHLDRFVDGTARNASVRIILAAR